MCLSTPPQEIPVRGPKELVKGEFRYSNEWSGDILKFKGLERVFYKDEEVFKTEYLGGLVDQGLDQM